MWKFWKSINQSLQLNSSRVCSKPPLEVKPCFLPWLGGWREILHPGGDVFVGTVETLKDPTSEGVPSHGLEGLIPAGFLDISENGGFSPPNQPLKHRVFHDFHHPFWGTPIFGNTQIQLDQNFMVANLWVANRGISDENNPHANLWSLAIFNDPCEGNKFLDFFEK